MCEGNESVRSASVTVLYVSGWVCAVCLFIYMLLTHVGLCLSKWSFWLYKAYIT